METIVDDLFSTLGVHFDTLETPSEIAEIRCYGVIRSLPKFMEDMGAKKGQFLWVSQSSWMEFSRNELEAWLVDAPAGDHIIIIESCNDVEIFYQCPSGVKLELWGRKNLRY